MHEGELGDLLVDLDVDVEAISSTTVRVSGADIELAQARIARAAQVSHWTHTREDGVVSVVNLSD